MGGKGLNQSGLACESPVKHKLMINNKKLYIFFNRMNNFSSRVVGLHHIDFMTRIQRSKHEPSLPEWLPDKSNNELLVRFHFGTPNRWPAIQNLFCPIV